VGVNALICPICREIIPLLAFQNHLETVHDVKIPKPRKIHVSLPKTETPTLATTWGKPYFVLFRIPIPEDKWETEEVHTNEQNYYLTDENGNPTPFPNPNDMIAQTVLELRSNGINPRYIKIEREKMLLQCHASPLPAWAIALIVIAVAAVLFGTAFYLVVTGISKLIAASMEFLQEYWYILLIILALATVAFLYQLSISRRRASPSEAHQI